MVFYLHVFYKTMGNRIMSQWVSERSKATKHLPLQEQFQMLGDKKNREEMHKMIDRLQFESNLAWFTFMILSFFNTLFH